MTGAPSRERRRDKGRQDSSTALEGNTLIRKEVEALLIEGKAVGSKELKDYLEVTGYAAAARWVYSQAVGQSPWTSGKLLTVTEVRHVHRLAMAPVWEVAPHPDASDAGGPGNWRKHDIHAFGGGMKPPSHTEVPMLLRDWVDSLGGLVHDSTPIAEAIAARHAAFERIHPFLDGNGRAGRLLLNLLLVWLGYPRPSSRSVSATATSPLSIEPTAAIPGRLAS